MPATWLVVPAWVALAAGFASAAWILVDVDGRGRRQQMPVMEAVWPVSGLHFGPAAVRGCRRFGRPASPAWRRARGLDEAPAKPGWASVATGVSHCGAGCTRGDVVAEFTVFGLGVTIAGTALWAKFIGDFVLALVLGVVYQYFAIAPVRGLGLRDGLKAAAKADVLSLMAFEVGLFGWMALMAFVFSPRPARSRLARVPVRHADRDDHRVLHRPARERVAHPARRQRGDVNRSAAAAASVRDAVRTRLWPLPVVAVLVAAAGGVLVPRLDAHVDGDLPSWFAQFLFDGDAGAARTLLDAVSSPLITVTSLTFSLTVVTLQLASSQFSPRLLRTFASDVFVQATLGVFLATFTFSLTALRAVGGSDTGTDEFVPCISVTVSFVLAVISVICLVLFLAHLAHLARQIRVETMLRDVHRDAEATASTVLEGRGGPALQPPPTARADTLPPMAPSSGFLVRVAADDLLDAARDADAVVVLDARLGDSVVDRTPIGRYWARQGTLDGDARTRLETMRGGRHAHRVRTDRRQDIGFGLRQLTDVANKALSPGFNDPTTAVHALGHISALLCDLADRYLGPAVLTDDDGIARVVLHRPDLDELGISQPHRYGAADSQVIARLLALLGELAWRARPEDHHVVVDQLRRLRYTIADQNFDTVERQTLERHARGVDDVLLRRTHPRDTTDRGGAG